MAGTQSDMLGDTLETGGARHFVALGALHRRREGICDTGTMHAATCWLLARVSEAHCNSSHMHEHLVRAVSTKVGFRNCCAPSWHSLGVV